LTAPLIETPVKKEVAFWGQLLLIKSREVDMNKLRMTGFERLCHLCNPLCEAFPEGDYGPPLVTRASLGISFFLMSFPIEHTRLNSFCYANIMEGNVPSKFFNIKKNHLYAFYSLGRKGSSFSVLFLVARASENLIYSLYLQRL
jgi:hypothetical protein